MSTKQPFMEMAFIRAATVRERTRAAVYRIRDGATLVLLVTCAILAAMIVGGCTKPPATEPQDVVDYIRNAKVGAEARLLDEPHQQRAERILAAYSTWQGKWQPLVGLAQRDALWPIESEKWRDGNVIDTRLKVVEQWMGAKQPSSTDGSSAKQARQQLLAAIAKTPYPEEIKERLTDTLIEEDKQRLLQAVATGYHTILTMIEQSRESFDASGSGLSFTDGEVTSSVVTQWRAIEDAIAAYAKDQLENVEEVLAEYPAERDAAIVKKKSLRTKPHRTVEDFRAYRRLELLVRYYDATIKWAEHEKKELAKAKS